MRTLSALQTTVLSAPYQQPFFVHIAYSNLRNVRVACPDSDGRPLSATGDTENVQISLWFGRTNRQTDKPNLYIDFFFD